jgi:hypothetical protein
MPVLPKPSGKFKVGACTIVKQRYLQHGTAFQEDTDEFLSEFPLTIFYPCAGKNASYQAPFIYSDPEEFIPILSPWFANLYVKRNRLGDGEGKERGKRGQGVRRLRNGGRGTGGC